MRLFSKTKLLMLTVMILLIISLTAGCSFINKIIPNGEGASSGKGLLGNKGASIEWWRVSYIGQYITTEAEHPGWQDVMKNTGITINFIHPPNDQAHNQYNLLYSSNDLADITEHHYWLPPDGPDSAIDDDRFLRLNELMEQSAPNFMKIVLANPKMMQQLKTDKGNIWSFPMLQDTQQPPASGMFIRRDLREKVGVDMPVTIDEWETMLVKFKDELEMTAPFAIYGTTFSDAAGLFSAYGINRTYYNDNGEVRYSPLEQGFKDYLTLMNKWYNMGLIANNFVAVNGSLLYEQKISDTSGAFYDWFGAMSHLKSVSENPDYMLESAPYPTLEKNDKKVGFKPVYNYVFNYHNAISANSQNIEDCVKLLDYCYSPEGYMTANYGREGDTYTMENGKVILTDKLMKNAEYNTYDASLMYLFHHGPYLRNYQSLIDAYEVYEQECMPVWGDSATMDKVMPPVTYTKEEGSRHSELLTAINAYEDDMILKFITGSMSLDYYSTFTDTLHQMGIDECINITQAALERFEAR